MCLHVHEYAFAIDCALIVRVSKYVRTYVFMSPYTHVSVVTQMLFQQQHAEQPWSGYCMWLTYCSYIVSPQELVSSVCGRVSAHFTRQVRKWMEWNIRYIGGGSPSHPPHTHPHNLPLTLTLPSPHTPHHPFTPMLMPCTFHTHTVHPTPHPHTHTAHPTPTLTLTQHTLSPTLTLTQHTLTYPAPDSTPSSAPTSYHCGQWVLVV